MDEQKKEEQKLEEEAPKENILKLMGRAFRQPETLTPEEWKRVRSVFTTVE